MKAIIFLGSSGNLTNLNAQIHVFVPDDFFAQHTTPAIFRSLDFGWEKLLKNNL